MNSKTVRDQNAKVCANIPAAVPVLVYYDLSDKIHDFNIVDIYEEQN